MTIVVSTRSVLHSRRSVVMVAKSMMTSLPRIAPLVPELDVSDIRASLAFYVQVLEFVVAWERPEERFVYLRRAGAQLMLQEAAGPGRRFRVAPLERPYGRGVNFQIEVQDVDALHRRVLDAGYQPILPLEERWYRTGPTSAGNRQFVVADPDGYLLRFFTGLPHPSE